MIIKNLKYPMNLNGSSKELERSKKNPINLRISEQPESLRWKLHKEKWKNQK